MWCYILILCVLFLSILYTNAVNMCTNQSASNKDVSLNLVNEADVSGCNCNVKLTRTDNIGSIQPRITFETVQFSGCKYKLVVSYNNTNSIISCSNNNSVFYDINKTDEIKLYLEPTNSEDEMTTFEVRITSNVTAIGGPLINLACNANPSVTSTQRSTTTTTLQPTQRSTTTTHTDTPNSTKPAYTPKLDDTDQDIGVDIIAGAVGGALLLILIIIIIICIVWRKKKKDEARKDNKPTVRESNPGYVNVDILHQDKGNNSSPDGAVIIDNVLYDGTYQKPNTEYAVVDKPTNKMSRDGSDMMNDSGNQKAETEYAVVNKVKPTKNASDSMNESVNQKAETQYAVVNKLRKPMDVTPQNGADPNSPNEPNSDRMFVIGPQGDEYALVQRN